MTDQTGEFRTREELGDLLENIGLRLHAKNRTAAGESVFLWHLAEALRATGRLALNAISDPELEGQFGNAYQTGSIPTGDELDHFLKLLKEQMIAKQ